MAHYDGYTEDDFKNLLELISHIEGKFLLSSYRSNILTDYRTNNKWHFIELKMRRCVGKKQHKIEVLTANFDIKSLKNELVKQL
jgi:DNA adenine methylase